MSLGHRKFTVLTIAAVFLLPSVGEVSGGSATTKMHIQATATTWLQYRMLKENFGVHLTKGNIKQGYKDADSNTVIQVTTNDLNGHVISLYCEAADFFTSVRVTTDTGASYELSPGRGVDIFGTYTGMEPCVTQIDFRFYLSQDARATDYPWPIVITVHPW